MKVAKCWRGGYKLVAELPGSNTWTGWDKCIWLCMHVMCICVYYACIMVVIIVVCVNMIDVEMLIC